jgi:hypothetical protein
MIQHLEDSQNTVRWLYVFLAFMLIVVAAVVGYSLASGDTSPKTTTQPTHQSPESPFANRPAQPDF